MRDRTRKKLLERIMLAAIVLCGAMRILASGETPLPYPLWDGHESVEAYASNVHLPATKSFEIAKGVALDLVLIPAGQFVMGTPKPPPPAVSEIDSNVMTILGGLLLAIAVVFLLWGTPLNQRVRFSLRWLLLIVGAAGLLIGGGARTRLAQQQFEVYKDALDHYNDLPEPEKGAHSVILTKPFYMGKYVVAQEQYEPVIGANASYRKGARLPQERVTWIDAVDYCDALNAKFAAQLSGGMKFQLPTEAQWEFACRAGTTTAFNTGDTISRNDANFVELLIAPSTGGLPRIWRGTTPVDAFKSNSFGLYDMHGNVRQWCQDFFHPTYSKESPAIDPVATTMVKDYWDTYVTRGGSYRVGAVQCRSAARWGNIKTSREFDQGFRVVLSVP